MPDLFISYSRRNGDFVRHLHELLTKDNKDVWVDFEDIPLSSSWWEEIKEGIESSDSFVFVLSPDSVSSPICNFEIAHAIEHNKRIVPIVLKLLDVEDGFTLVLKEKLNDSEVQILGTRNLEEVARATWNGIARHNWLFFNDDEAIEANYKKLLEVLDTDLDYVRIHTRLLVRAREWQNAGKAPGLLLNSTETAEAENWQTLSAGKIPQLTPLHTEYIHASREKHRRRQRQTLIAVSVALVATVFLAILALGFAGIARTNAIVANNNAITATIAQGAAENNAAEAQRQADIAATNAQNALDNAATATFAQGRAEENEAEALRQANIAATNAQSALNNAATATFAQGKAQINGTQAANSAYLASTQAAAAETQAHLARDRAVEAATAQFQAVRSGSIAETQAAIANDNFIAAETARALSVESAARAETQAARAEAQATIAESNRRDAIAAQENVVIERNQARSIALAAQAETELDLQSANKNPERAVILAIAALERFGVTWQAERALSFGVADTLRPMPLFQHETHVSAIVLTDDGQRMVTADDTGLILIWDATEFRVLHHLVEHAGKITSVHLSPDNTRILTTSEDTTARIWDIETGLAQRRFRAHSGVVLGGAWSPDGSQVVTYGSDGTALIWNAATGEITARLVHDGIVRAADWSPDGKLIVTGGGNGLAWVWSPDGNLQLKYNGHLQTARQERFVAVTAVAFSPDGSMVATGGTDENIHIWNPQTGELITMLEGHVLDISKLIWSHNSRWLASLDGLNANNFTEENATARIWNLEDENNRFAIFDHVGVVTDAAWSPNGTRLATVGKDGFLYISDAASGGQLLGLGESESLTVVAWAADGSALITGNERGAIRVWPYWTDAGALVAYARSCCVLRALTDEEARQFGLPLPTSMPLPEIVTQCENGSAMQRAYPGTRGRVVLTGDPSPLNVRNRPTTLARVEAQIPPGQTFRVIDGPICDERSPIAWYQVQYGLNAAVGFVAEGEGDVYFIEPLP